MKVHPLTPPQNIPITGTQADQMRLYKLATNLAKREVVTNCHEIAGPPLQMFNEDFCFCLLTLLVLGHWHSSHFGQNALFTRSLLTFRHLVKYMYLTLVL